MGPLGTVVAFRVVGKGPHGAMHLTVTGCNDVAPGAVRSLRGVCSCWCIAARGHVVGDALESHAGREGQDSEFDCGLEVQENQRSRNRDT